MKPDGNTLRKYLEAEGFDRVQDIIDAVVEWMPMNSGPYEGFDDGEVAIDQMASDIENDRIRERS